MIITAFKSRLLLCWGSNSRKKKYAEKFEYQAEPPKHTFPFFYIIKMFHHFFLEYSLLFLKNWRLLLKSWWSRVIKFVVRRKNFSFIWWFFFLLRLTRTRLVSDFEICVISVKWPRIVVLCRFFDATQIFNKKEILDFAILLNSSEFT